MTNETSLTSPPPVIRRAVLAAFAGTLCIPTVAIAPMRASAPDPLDVIRRTADLLAGQMAEAHGGVWAATVERGFVLVQREGGAQ